MGRHFADTIARRVIDRFTSNAYDLIIEGESYRPRLKPRLAPERKERAVTSRRFRHADRGHRGALL
jgi:hypothetical protein